MYDLGFYQRGPIRPNYPPNLIKNGLTIIVGQWFYTSIRKVYNEDKREITMLENNSMLLIDRCTDKELFSSYKNMIL